jgi:thioredoxin-dependent peroxiredoxin
LNRIEKRWLNQQFPEFKMFDEDGEQVSSTSLIGKWSVIFFYPKDETPGCTIQARTFAKYYGAFLAFNCQVIGISSGTQQSHKEFQCNSNLPYSLLIDKKSTLRRNMDLGKTLGRIPKRVTFIIDEMGVIRYIFDSQFAVKTHVAKALSFLKTNSNNYQL